MTDEETIRLIGMLNDYADKRNNSTMKNIVLATLLSIVVASVTGILAYSFKEVYALRDENMTLQGRVVHLEAKQDAAMREQNRMMFAMLERLKGIVDTVPLASEAVDTEPSVPETDDYKWIVPNLSGVVGDDKKFELFHSQMEQRVQDRIPSAPEFQK